MEPTTTLSAGFTVEKPGEHGCFFRVEHPVLQDWLISEGVVSPYRRKTFRSLTLNYLMSAVDAESFFTEAEALYAEPKEGGEGEESSDAGMDLHEDFIRRAEELMRQAAGQPQLDPEVLKQQEALAKEQEAERRRLIRGFVEAFRQERDKLIERAAKVKERGAAHFNELAYAFKPEDAIVIRRGEDVIHGALIKSITEGASMMGRYVAVEYKFVIFNGDKFVFTENTTYVMEYEGEAKLRDLSFYPMDDQDRDKLAKRGTYYRTVNGERVQAQYVGNVVRQSFFGPRYYRADGRVMVDIKSFRKIDPNYREFYGRIPGSDAVEVKADDDQTLALCSPYVYGFSFYAKQWGEFLLDSVSPAKYVNNAFDRVVLPAKRKRIISALVASDMGKFSDIVEGKGGGLIFLLAGPPGVGKTITAEAIAEQQERPIYIASAGELGTDPSTVEAKLSQILDMAVMWNAVLLIDECDIFLERRTKQDLERNALVAIFLRLLEYYPGILFLTTNRVNELDEAFLSRISLALHYNKLDEGQRREIWRGLADGHEFDTLDYDALAKHELNGREIKSCLRLALALAGFEKRRPTQEDVEEMVGLRNEFAEGSNAQEGEPSA